MSQKEWKALRLKGIRPGMFVTVPWGRGVGREGTVTKILTTKEETPYPPKV